MAIRTNTAKWLEGQKRWQINVQKDGKRRTFTCSTPGRTGQRICNKKADDWLENNIVDPRIKVQTLWAKLIETKKAAGHSRSQWSQFDQYGRNYVFKVIGHRRVASLTEQDLQDVIFYAHQHPVKGNPLSYKSLHAIRDCLCAFIKFARKNNISTLIPEFLVIPKDAPRPEKRALQPKDIYTLLTSDDTTYRDKVVKDWYIHAFRLAAIVGLRPGELYGLRKGDVDIDTGECRICGAINFFNEATRGKNKNALRTFVLPDIALSEVRAQITMLRQHGVISPYLFPDQNGNATKQSVAYRQWIRYREHNGISDITPYELRHTFFSVNKEVPKELVKMVGGHSDEFDTFGTYGHRLEGELTRAAELINDAYVDILRRAKK
jgi:integrase